jgi:hypothetical protein
MMRIIAPWLAKAGEMSARTPSLMGVPLAAAGFAAAVVAVVGLAAGAAVAGAAGAAGGAVAVAAGAAAVDAVVAGAALLHALSKTTTVASAGQARPLGHSEKDRRRLAMMRSPLVCQELRRRHQYAQA